jgi:hypothetical protein
LKSRYKIEIEHPDRLPDVQALNHAQEEVHYCLVEERIQKKHTAYRKRFKRWRKFVNLEEESSPLVGPEEEEEVYLDHSGPPSSDEEDEDLTSHEDPAADEGEQPESGPGIFGHDGSDGFDQDETSERVDGETMDEQRKLQESLPRGGVPTRTSTSGVSRREKMGRRDQIHNVSVGREFEE